MPPFAATKNTLNQAMKKSINYARLSGFVLLMCLSHAHADNEEFALCAKKHKNNDAERLKCYDSALHSTSLIPDVRDETNSKDIHHQVSLPLPESNHDSDEAAPQARSYLTKAWNLDNANVDGRLGHLVPHRQSYLLARKTFNSNTQPISPAIGRSVLTPNNIDVLESKYQFSFKTDIIGRQRIDFEDFKTFRLWAAYTQQSNWQVFNTRNSSPFRETNYEPELIASFDTDNTSDLKLVNLGLVHQSNGQSLPGSRSWNRVYLQGGWEWDKTSILARGWWRVPENILKDDNPDISNYVGRADLVVRREFPNQKQALTMLLRNNLNFPSNRGFIQLDWSMKVPWLDSLLLHAQLTSGFGESMIDYNHSQTTLGLGFSFQE